MSNIPSLYIQGKTDAEKIAELIAYLPTLSSALERELSSIDFSNLNENLSSRISNSITEHQDLTGFVSKNYSKNHFYDKKAVDEIASTLSEQIEDAVKDIENTLSQYSNAINTLSENVSSLAGDVSALGQTVGKLDDYVNDYGGVLNVTLQYELREIKKRLKTLEG